MKTLADLRCTEDLARRLRTVRPDSARQWGTMTAHQMICHMCDTFRMAAGDRPVSDAPVPLPRPIVKWIALYLPLRWRAGIMTRPEIDQRCDGTKPREFAADVAEAEGLMRSLVSRSDGFVWPSHPFFGRMSRADWMRWGYLHTDHHLRQFGA
jgi:hypothetical protein